jgi:hypothetical protein
VDIAARHHGIGIHKLSNIGKGQAVLQGALDELEAREMLRTEPIIVASTNQPPHGLQQAFGSVGPHDTGRHAGCLSQLGESERPRGHLHTD